MTVSDEGPSQKKKEMILIQTGYELTAIEEKIHIKKSVINYTLLESIEHKKSVS